MRRHVLIPSMVVTLTALLFGVQHVLATRPNDTEAVKATVTDYIEGYYTGDVARMERALHPDYLKHTITAAGSVSQWTGLKVLARARSGEGKHLPVSDRTSQVTVLDVAQGIAVAKLVTPGWTDYLTLTKSSGTWQIITVTLQETR
jgi:putative lumazine-binding protein